MSDHEPINRRELLRGRFARGILSHVAEVIGEGVDALASAGDTSSAERPDPVRPTPASARYQKSFPVLRPPGAVEEELFLAGCTRCNACIEACPHDAIVHAPPRFRRAAGTPMIDPVKAPCYMCPDTPCIPVCEPGVLRLDLPRKMGTARIDRITCLAWQNSFCTVCSEHCPVPGAIASDRGRPTVVEDVCTGCGVCQYVCPAPQNAVLLMPLPERPARPAEEQGDGGEHAFRPPDSMRPTSTVERASCPPDDGGRTPGVASGSIAGADSSRSVPPGERPRTGADATPGSAPCVSDDRGVEPPLPPMNDAVLSNEEVAQLFRDIRVCTQQVEVVVKAGPGHVAPSQPYTLDDAETLVASRSVRGVQLRYRYDGAAWCDTLMLQRDAVRLIRVRHEIA